MSDISDWSTSASSNNSTSPDGFPEGMPPSGLNDSCRELMAAIRRWYEDAVWVDFGYAYTRISAGIISITGDHTATHHVGRRIKMSGSATAYATIETSTYSAPDTQIVIAEDNCPATLDSVALSIIGVENSPMPYNVTDYARLSAANIFTGVNTVSGTSTQWRFNETDAATDEKCWSWEFNGGNGGLYARADSFGSGSVPLYFTRNGTTVTTCEIQSTTITFSGNVAVNSTNPVVRLYDSDGSANEQYYSWEANAGGFGLYFRTDALGSGSIPISIARTGTVCDSITFTSTIVAFSARIKQTPVTVAALPSAATAGSGARYFVSDANATTFASIVAGGGSNPVPVYSDGTNWRIG